MFVQLIKGHTVVAFCLTHENKSKQCECLKCSCIILVAPHRKSKLTLFFCVCLECQIFNKSKSPSQSVAGKSETEKIVSKSFCAQSKHFPLSIDHAFGCSYQSIPSLLNGFASLNVAKVKHIPALQSVTAKKLVNGTHKHILQTKDSILVRQKKAHLRRKK